MHIIGSRSLVEGNGVDSCKAYCEAARFYTGRQAMSGSVYTRLYQSLVSAISATL